MCLYVRARFNNFTKLYFLMFFIVLKIILNNIAQTVYFVVN